MAMQGEAIRDMFGTGAGGLAGAQGFPEGLDPAALSGGMAEWAGTAAQLQQLWLDFLTWQAGKSAAKAQKGTNLLDPAQWLVISQSMLTQMPGDLFKAQGKLVEESMQLWQGMAERFIPKPGGGGLEPADPTGLPRADRRFADPSWRETRPSC
jgi:polyhydroxyalkanoate synthase subunit PhaC